MTKKVNAKAKFGACMTNSILKIPPFDLGHERSIRKYDKDIFFRILIKTELEEFSELLYDHFLNILDLNNLNVSTYFSFNSHLKDTDEFKLELLETLRFLLIQQNDTIKSITLQKSRDKHRIQNEQLIFIIERFLQDLFNKHYNHKRPASSDYTELNLINLDKLILDYKLILSSKQGAKVKNQPLVILAMELGDLLRVNRFLQSNDITDLDQIKLIAKNYRLMYQILDFWGFTPQREKNDSTEDKYLATTIRQSRKYSLVNPIRKEKFATLKQELTFFLDNSK